MNINVNEGSAKSISQNISSKGAASSGLISAGVTGGNTAGIASASILSGCIQSKIASYQSVVERDGKQVGALETYFKEVDKNQARQISSSS